MDEASGPRSPRLATWQRELAAGRRDALAGFWAEAAAGGGPLIEPLPDTDGDLLVTFLWRGDAALQRVALIGALAEPDFAQSLLARLDETDVWFRSYAAPRGLRMDYIFAPDADLAPIRGAEDWLRRVADWRPDPLNPHAWAIEADPDDPSQPGMTTSILELPDASPQPWLASQPGVPAGHVEAQRLHSAVLGDERGLWVYTPAGYDPNGPPCALLVQFDGRRYCVLIPLPTLLDNLIAAGRLPPLVAVMVGSADQQSRNRELACLPAFNAFLVDELLPWLRARYRVTDDPARVVVSGSSLGGLAAAHAALRHPECFGNVLAQSGAFFWKPSADSAHEWLTQQFAAAPRLPLRFYLDAGTLETRPAGPGRPPILETNHRLRDTLWAKGYPVQYAEFSGGHDYICWRATLPAGLIALLGEAPPAGR